MRTSEGIAHWAWPIRLFWATLPCLFIVGGTLSTEAAAPPTSPVSAPAEIGRWIDALGATDEQIRSQAYQSLRRAGPISLRQLNSRQPRIGPKDARTILRLYDEIQSEHGVQPVTEGGLSFLPTGDRQWRVPPAGGQSAVRLGVRVTNSGQEPLCFARLDSIIPFLVDAEGRPVERTYCRTSVAFRNYLAGPLKTGESSVANEFSCRLAWGKDNGSLELTLTDGSGLFLRVRGLVPGRYYLAYACGHHPDWWSGAGMKKDGCRIWSGNTVSTFVPISIK